MIPEEIVPKDLSRFAENLLNLLRSSGKWPRSRQDRFVAEAVERLEVEVGTLGPGKMPLSLSLFQFAFGVLAREAFLNPFIASAR